MEQSLKKSKRERAEEYALLQQSGHAAAGRKRKHYYNKALVPVSGKERKAVFTGVSADARTRRTREKGKKKRRRERQQVAERCLK